MDTVLYEIKAIAKKYDIQKVVLFGSRVRRDHSHVSNYDIAVFLQDISSGEQAKILLDVEDIETLHKINLVFVDINTDKKLLENINREGIIIYEQISE